MTEIGRHTAVLPAIPVEEADPVALVDRQWDRFTAVVAEGERHYPWLLRVIGDRLSRRWLEGRGNPYLGELRQIADRLGRPGVYALNLSFEWTCTCGVARGPDGASRLLRVFDWVLPGLGRTLVAAWQNGPAGRFLNLTWPGFTGVVTAMAPGRFAAAMNQPPMASHGLGLPGDWLVAKRRMWRTPGLPPAHLLRRVFEECRDYGEARRRLAEEPICLPAFFILGGAAPGDGCVIERTERQAFLHPMPAAIANHWLDRPAAGRARGGNSTGRHRRMTEVLTAPPGDLSWLAPPLLNRDTRLAAVLDPATGRAVIQGFEAHGAATAMLELS